MKQMVRLVSIISLRHEDDLALIRLDRGFVLHQRTKAQQSILATMLDISSEWKTLQKEGKVKSSLRLTLFRCFMTEFQSRVATAVTKQQTRDFMLQMGWVVTGQDGTVAWNYMQYENDEQKEIPDQDVKPLPHQTLLTTLAEVSKLANEETLHRFHAKRPMSENYEGDVLGFLIQISLRGPQANALFEALLLLVRSSSMSLMGAGLRRERIRRTPAATQLSKMLDNKSFPWCS